MLVRLQDYGDCGLSACCCSSGFFQVARIWRYTSSHLRIAGSLALALASHLSAVGREVDAIDAARQALQLFERYDRERTRPAYQEEQVALASPSTRVRPNSHSATGCLISIVRRSGGAASPSRPFVTEHRPRLGSLGVALNQVGSFEESTNAFSRALELDSKYFEGRWARQGMSGASQQGRRYAVE